MSKIAVLGYGVVGSGTVEVFYASKKKTEEKLGKEFDIKYILDLRDFPDSPYADKFTKNYDDILNDSEVTIVVEAMGGLHPSYEFVSSALKAGKSAVTSNKELVAQKGAELLRLAKENGVSFLFEASVGGGIPIIRPLHRCLAGNDIEEIAGILNGTTNFILTKMFGENMDFDLALKMAQDLGYAEHDPSADVDGLDSCRKICILASLAFGRHIYPDSVKTQGIREITIEDVKYADAWGGKIRLIAWAKKVDGKVLAMVCPAFIKNASQLASTSDVFNAVLVRGSATGDVVFYGRGAGKLPTASAMVGDIIEIINCPETSKTLTWVDSEQDFLQCPCKAEVAKYVRLVSDNSDIKRQIENAFGEVSYLDREDKPADEVAFVTPVLTDGEIDAKLENLDAKVITTIRILNY